MSFTAEIFFRQNENARWQKPRTNSLRLLDVTEPHRSATKLVVRDFADHTIQLISGLAGVDVPDKSWRIEQEKEKGRLKVNGKNIKKLYFEKINPYFHISIRKHKI